MLLLLSCITPESARDIDYWRYCYSPDCLGDDSFRKYRFPAFTFSRVLQATMHLYCNPCLQSER
jgi:hypothetical protein